MMIFLNFNDDSASAFFSSMASNSSINPAFKANELEVLKYLQSTRKEIAILYRCPLVKQVFLNTLPIYLFLQLSNGYTYGTRTIILSLRQNLF